MFSSFIYKLRNAGIMVSMQEYLMLLEALKLEVADYKLDSFYALCRSIMVKRESQLDRFDQIFGAHFKEIESIDKSILTNQIPEDWLKDLLTKHLSEEEKATIEKLGGLDALMDRFKELMEEQQEKHQGGNKWIGSGGTSPFGRGGYHPEGFRMGPDSAGHRTAIKVWEKRNFKNLDGDVELNTRNMKLLLKRLRHLTREGIPTELDLNDTIKRTSENAGLLDISLVPSKQNRVKVLLLMDVGGSMDDHVELCAQLFSAAKHEFKHLEYYYFHNCLYESVWKDNNRRFQQRIPTLEIIHKYNKDYKLIFVGDAAMSPYEIYYRGGSVEHYNDEPGISWLKRMRDHFPNMIWINPNPEYTWAYYESTSIIREFTRSRMFPMTLNGIKLGIQCLKNKSKTFDNEVWGEES